MEGGKLAVAKRCLDEIFLDTYKKRDKIAVITAGGENASYLLPFTSNIEKGRTLIDSIGFGGTSPLSSGIKTGLHILEDIMRKEPWLVPIIVIITDGGANVPLFLGGKIEEEFSRLSDEMDHLGIRPLIIDVGERSTICEDIVRRTDGKYLPIGFNEEGSHIDLEMEADIEKILDTALASLASQEPIFTVFSGYNSNAIEHVNALLSETPIEVDVKNNCHYGCSPDSDTLCKECRYTQNDTFGTSKKPLGYGVISEDHSEKDLNGELFVRYIVDPGLLMRADNGLLFVENDNAYTKFSDLLEECIRSQRCQVSNEEYTEYYRFKPRGVFLFLDDINTNVPVKYRRMIKKEDIQGKMWKVMAQKKMKSDPSRFKIWLEERRIEKINAVNDFINGKISIEIPEYITEIISDELDEEASKRLFSLMRAEALIKDMDTVNLGVLQDSLEYFVIDKSDDNETLSQYLFTKLALSLVNKKNIKLTLVKGYSLETFRQAVDMLSSLPINIQVPIGCSMNCHPSDIDLCPECSLKYKGKTISTETVGLPWVCIRGDESLEEIRGELLVKYCLTSDTLVKANRGIFVIESIKDMKDEVAEFISDILKTGTFTVKNNEYSRDIDVRISIIARNEGENFNRLIQDHLGYVINKQGYESLLPSFIDTDNYDVKNKEIVEKIKYAGNLINQMDITDSHIDLIARTCAELGLHRYDAEIKIEQLAKLFSAWEGCDLDPEMITNSFDSIAPVLSETNANMF